MGTKTVLVTREYTRQHLIERLHADLLKQAIHLSEHTIEQVLDAYDKRTEP